MKYEKAQNVLPVELITIIQQYTDGTYLYIPRKADEKRGWGEKSGTRASLKIRNKTIYQRYNEGQRIDELSEEYFLSHSQIKRIIKQFKE